ncbi:MAG: DUF3131 domain-containing protein, partial [Gammaproteobacteria bacterium]|nr:DUF3131 domain-containing protein [Gammaproteobacteria bacterium]
QHGGMIDFSNQPSETGWSALDIGRLLVWLKVLAARYPEYSEYIDKAVLRWNFCDVVDKCGTLYGGSKANDEIQLYQEGRLGYEEYAASGYQLWGFDTRDASDFQPYEMTRVLGIDIPIDGRDARVTGTYAPILTVPYTLHGLEFNWDSLGHLLNIDGVHTNREMADIAQRVYEVQEARYIDEKVFTARTDHQLGKPPYFLYDSIFAAGYPWNTIADDGSSHDDLALVSTRAAFGMWALWHTEYTDRLMLVIKELYDPERGWYEGRYERTGGHEKTFTASTNAMVLEALLYKVQGKLYQEALEPSHGQLLLHEVFRRPAQQCFPPERPICE